MTPTRRLVLLVAAACLSILGLLGALAFGIWASLTPGQHDVVGDILAEQAGLLVGCALLFVTLLSIGLAVFLGRYAGAAKRLAAETELIASVNPDHRVAPEGAGEMRSLADAGFDMRFLAELPRSGAPDPPGRRRDAHARPHATGAARRAVRLAARVPLEEGVILAPEGGRGRHA